MDQHSKDATRLAAGSAAKHVSTPIGLVFFFQTKIKQIDQSRYIAPSLVCAVSPQREHDGDGYLWNTLKTRTCLTDSLSSFKVGKQAPHNMLINFRKATCQRFPELQREVSCHHPASLCAEAFSLPAAHPNQLHL